MTFVYFSVYVLLFIKYVCVCVAASKPTLFDILVDLVDFNGMRVLCERNEYV